MHRLILQYTLDTHALSLSPIVFLTWLTVLVLTKQTYCKARSMGKHKPNLAFAIGGDVIIGENHLAKMR